MNRRETLRALAGAFAGLATGVVPTPSFPTVADESPYPEEMIQLCREIVGVYATGLATRDVVSEAKFRELLDWQARLEDVRARHAMAWNRWMGRVHRV
jgi:hypothetical protein